LNRSYIFTLDLQLNKGIKNIVKSKEYAISHV
jgi:hypothetical protein